MRKPIVAGNWKMYGSTAMVKELLTSLTENIDKHSKTEAVVFPPYVYLQQAADLLQGSTIHWGAQNVSEYLDGAYTGEISVKMLNDFNCEYVIVGHSERRTIFHETDQQIAEKFFTASRQGLNPILCVGETLNQRESEQTFEVVAAQLESVFAKQENSALLKNGVIAYEPVWAIGTGVTATPEQAQEVHAFIRKFVEKYDKTLAQNLRILYGGSVKSSNAQQLFRMPDIDGGLIGGASLHAKEFLEIISLCNSYC